MNAIEKIMKQMEVAKKVQEIANEVDLLRVEAAMAHAQASVLRDMGKRDEVELYSNVVKSCWEKAMALQKEAESLQEYYVKNLMF